MGQAGTGRAGGDRAIRQVHHRDGPASVGRCERKLENDRNISAVPTRSCRWWCSSTFEPRKIGKLRIANCVGGPSFTEVAVYEKPVPPVAVLASDANGGIIGIVTDKYGSAPVNGAEVVLSGRAKIGPVASRGQKQRERTVLRADAAGAVRPGEGDRRRIEGGTSETAVDAANLQYGLTPLEHGCPSHDTWTATSGNSRSIRPTVFGNRSSMPVRGPTSKCRPIGRWKVFTRADNVGGYLRKFEAPGRRRQAQAAVRRRLQRRRSLGERAEARLSRRRLHAVRDRRDRRRSCRARICSR